MRQKRTFCIYMVLFMVAILTACGAGNSNFANSTVPDFTKVSSEAMIRHFTVVGDDCTAALTYREDNSLSFVRYEKGKEVFSKTLTDNYEGLYFWQEGDCFFAYNKTKLQLEKLNIDFELQEVLQENWDVFEIKHMAVKENSLYLLSVSENPYASNPSLDETSGYMDFGEEVFAIDLGTKKSRKLPIEHAICQYLAEDGNLYYYTYENNSYTLQKYDISYEKLRRISKMDDVGYIYSFVLIGDEFIYAGLDSMDITIKNINTDLITSKAENIYIMRGMDFQGYKGSMIYLNREDATIDAYFPQRPKTSEEGMEQEFYGEELVLGTASAYYIPVKMNKLEADYGIAASAYETEFYDNELLLKLMAGDKDVDIYICTINTNIGRNIRKNGIYVPLNDSEKIRTALEGYWDYLEDFCYCENGDIWGVPIAVDMEVTWYVPENMEKLGLTVTDLELFNSFLLAQGKVKEQDKYEYYGEATTFANDMRNLYHANYGYLDYDNEIYRDWFTKMWDGWIRWSGPYAQHPTFQNINEDPEYEEGKEYNTEKVAFKSESVAKMLTRATDLSGWRACAFPKLASTEEKSPLIIYYAFVNPYSENIEAAKAYLSYIVGNPQEYTRIPEGALSMNFVYKDKEAYAEKYDIHAPWFEDVFCIYEQGAVYEALLSNSDYAYIDEYQNGRWTLDETIEYLERQAEMYMNE